MGKLAMAATSVQATVGPAFVEGAQQRLRRTSAYRRDIDGLRCIAVLVVLVFHASPKYLPSGFIGVDIFFVISGFLISGILLREAQEGRFSLASFYSRRVRRIFPALALVLAFTLIAGWLLLVASYFANLGKHVAAGAGFVANIALWQEANYFSGNGYDRPLLHLWSLGVEEQFYLAWPLFIYGITRFKIDPLRALAVVTAASFACSVYLTWNDPTAAFYSPASRCWQLSLGGLAAALSARDVRMPDADLLSWAGGAMIAAGLFFIKDASFWPGFWAVLPTGGTALLLLAGEHGKVNRLLAVRPAVWVGLISYPLYLWHWPLLSLAYVNNALWGHPENKVVLVLMAFAAAFLTYRLVELPLKRSNPIALAGAVATIGLAGLLVYASHGLPGRPVNRDGSRQLLSHYLELQANGLRAAYREECNFLVAGELTVRQEISNECTAPGAAGTWFLWGDSHAQALSLGLRAQLPQGYRLAQVATSGCRPSMPQVPGWFEPSSAFGRACRKSNPYALQAIARLKPDIVFLVQQNGHEGVDWEALAAHLRKLGARQVVLIGPVPEWEPSLPMVVAPSWPNLPTFVSQGLDGAVLATDATMRSRTFQNLTYVSVIPELCRQDGCLARIGPELIAVDYGHLSPRGSLFVGKLVGSALALPDQRTR